MDAIQIPVINSSMGLPDVDIPQAAFLHIYYRFHALVRPRLEDHAVIGIDRYVQPNNFASDYASFAVGNICVSRQFAVSFG